MNRLVYLFELDSAKNSPAEIKAGQEALFEELVLNGSQVVLTFNQITDSAAFLAIMQDENMFPQVLELFRMGALQVSPYQVKTVSQYLQEALTSKKDKGDAGFIFSGVPIDGRDKDLIETMTDTLKYGNAICEAHIALPRIAISIIQIVLFGCIASMIAEKCRLPDFLESFRNIGQCIADLWYIRQALRGNATLILEIYD